MHVGKKDKYLCPVLKVHGSEILTSDKENYLGDILTTDGRIDQNIIDRYNKGMGKTNEIMSILQEVSFGPHSFQMAILFRESILLSSMLGSSEVLYGITKTHIEKLEQADRIFFRRLFEVPNCTAIESFYLETSTIPIRFLLMKKRIFYYWDILQKDETELVKKVFNSQKLFSVRNDWVLQVQSDLDECDIQLTESEMATMKRYSFTKLINEKINQSAAQYLIGLREKHSKSDNLKFSSECNLTLVMKKCQFKERS